MDPLLDRLLSQAYLFDDPAAYEADVRDAFELLVTHGSRSDAAEIGGHRCRRAPRV